MRAGVRGPRHKREKRSSDFVECSTPPTRLYIYLLVHPNVPRGYPGLAALITSADACADMSPTLRIVDLVSVHGKQVSLSDYLTSDTKRVATLGYTLSHPSPKSRCASLAAFFPPSIGRGPRRKTAKIHQDGHTQTQIEHSTTMCCPYGPSTAFHQLVPRFARPPLLSGALCLASGALYPCAHSPWPRSLTGLRQNTHGDR